MEQRLARLSAEDLSALIVLSAQVWVELPPWTRLDYEAALGREHALQVADASVDLPRLEPEDRYLRLIERSLLVDAHPADRRLFQALR